MAAKFRRVVGRYAYVTVKGVEYRVNFEEAGQGTPMLFQHTAGSDGRQWRYLLESSDLISRFRFVAHDLPYHGKSLPPLSKAWWRERYSLSQSFLVEFVEAMIGALDMEKPIYVGCSMGGHLAPDLALLRPGLFRAVVAVEGGLATHDPEPFNTFIVMEGADIDKAVDAAIASKFFFGGSVCTCNDRIYLHAAIHDQFLDKFLARVKALKVGDPTDPKSDIGPRISAVEVASSSRLSRARSSRRRRSSRTSRPPAKSSIAATRSSRPSSLSVPTISPS
jgi:pimeloyl-ACP methyl ester carboxylesterase